jgi:hypothetical protein
MLKSSIFWLSNTVPKQQATCAMCQLIRTYLLIAVPLIALFWFQPEMNLLKGVSLTNLASVFFGVAFLVTVGWKAYHEFWKDRNRG